MGWFRRLFGANDSGAGSAAPDPIQGLRARCDDLDRRILWSREKLGERSSALADLQLQYAEEHARLQQSLDDLHAERLRNSNLFSKRDLMIARAKLLQTRVGHLKERLVRYEAVADGPFDHVPIVLENAPPPGDDSLGGGFKLH